MRPHEVVMEWIREGLASGRLQIGDRLLGERALSETLGVSRGSLREAMRILDTFGMIRSSTGSGPNAGTIITAIPEQALSLSLNLQIATKHVEHEHIFEVRTLLETWAAQNSDPNFNDWEDATRILELMDNPDISIKEFLSYDAQFHVALSRAAGNPLISTLMDSLRISVSEYTLTRSQSLVNWSATLQRLMEEHKQILKAIMAGDRELGAELLRVHIQGYYQETDAGPSS